MRKPPSTKGKGKLQQWLRDRMSYAGDDCLIWPFGRLPNGYGLLGYEREGAMRPRHTNLAAAGKADPYRI